MRILIVTQIFLPEMGALSNRLYPFVRELAAAGHEVFVATGMPNYPGGKIFKEYRGKFFMREEKENCTIFRTNYIVAPRNKSKWRQLISYISFMPAVFFSGWRAGKLDAVIITSPPIFPLIPAAILKKLRRAKLVFDIRDLWSEELITYGQMKESSLPVRIFKALENWGYRKADLITATTHSIIETISECGAKSENTVFLPNGADLEIFHPLPAGNPIADSYNFDKKFVVMYAGLFGIKHGLETLLDAAELLKNKKDIIFFLIGNGARREALKKIVKEKSLTNVILAKERDVKDIPYILARADICYASTKPEPYPKKLISIKLFEYMACEKPIIGGFSGESAAIIENSKSGIVVEPGNASALAKAVEELYQDILRCRKMSKAGRRFVEKNYSRSAWAKQFRERIEYLIKEKQSELLPKNKKGMEVRT